MTNDAAHVNGERENKAHEECAEKEIVTKDVTFVSNEVEENQAHNECAEDERVANDVTQVNGDEKKRKAHKEYVVI